MKRLGKLFGLAAGLAAVLWAMRDRFVSIAAPREPEPPAFRVVPPPPEPADGDGEDLTKVRGIGPVYADRLRSVGITDLAELAAADPAKVAEAADVTPERAADWVSQASALA